MPVIGMWTCSRTSRTCKRTAALERLRRPPTGLPYPRTRRARRSCSHWLSNLCRTRRATASTRTRRAASARWAARCPGRGTRPSSSASRRLLTAKLRPWTGSVPRKRRRRRRRARPRARRSRATSSSACGRRGPSRRRSCRPSATRWTAFRFPRTSSPVPRRRRTTTTTTPTPRPRRPPRRRRPSRAASRRSSCRRRGGC
mmetsp:Transcript_13039/g.37981  ORF Transcript_13039/g.37981 Transcript_13039/m.37981 type:complete len:200 (+) Transcript_13039:3041-3640(+)